MISMKAKYAFKALVYLAAHSGTVQIDGIARDERIPRKFLEHILLELKAGGFIASRRGRSGGYALARPAAEISVGQVLRLIDGPMAPLPCISRTAYRRCEDCRDEATCGVRRMFADAHSASLRALEGTTIADALRAGAPAIVDDSLQEAMPVA